MRDLLWDAGAKLIGLATDSGKPTSSRSRSSAKGAKNAVKQSLKEEAVLGPGAKDRFELGPMLFELLGCHASEGDDGFVIEVPDRNDTSFSTVRGVRLDDLVTDQAKRVAILDELHTYVSVRNIEIHDAQATAPCYALCKCWRVFHLIGEETVANYLMTYLQLYMAARGRYLDGRKCPDAFVVVHELKEALEQIRAWDAYAEGHGVRDHASHHNIGTQTTENLAAMTDAVTSWENYVNICVASGIDMSDIRLDMILSATNGLHSQLKSISKYIDLATVMAGAAEDRTLYAGSGPGYTLRRLLPHHGRTGDGTYSQRVDMLDLIMEREKAHASRSADTVSSLCFRAFGEHLEHVPANLAKGVKVCARLPQSLVPDAIDDDESCFFEMRFIEYQEGGKIASCATCRYRPAQTHQHQ
ncbi:hypothetical protein JL721_11298 [Aureococcus anophagefferens]|nr:hypothetical protein JL721_11298 [Aureococcus anophagefferens]